MTERPINFSLLFCCWQKEGQIFLGHEKKMNEWRFFVPLFSMLMFLYRILKCILTYTESGEDMEGFASSLFFLGNIRTCI